MAERIQLKRTKGWRMPPNTVKVDRSTKFGNPFKDPSRRIAVNRFRIWIDRSPLGKVYMLRAHRELHGKNLACWCPLDEPCHADVLLENVNA